MLITLITSLKTSGFNVFNKLFFLPETMEKEAVVSGLLGLFALLRQVSSLTLYTVPKMQGQGTI